LNEAEQVGDDEGGCPGVNKTLTIKLKPVSNVLMRMNQNNRLLKAYQLRRVAREHAGARTLAGKISPMKSHGTGPIPSEKKTMYPISDPSASLWQGAASIRFYAEVATGTK
jgi:hypothetical protein